MTQTELETLPPVSFSDLFWVWAAQNSLAVAGELTW